MVSRYFLLNNEKVYFKAYGKDFLILKKASSSPLSFSRLGQSIFNAQLNFADEVIATENEICIKLNTHYNERSIYAIESLKVESSQEQRQIKLPIYFEMNDDWAHIIEHTGLDFETYISFLTRLKITVAMLGFLPGFVYLNKIPTQMRCPRKSTPSKNVKPNSFAMAAQYLGIYSLASPSGWHVLGQLACDIQNLPHTPPTLLHIDDQIQIEAISLDQYQTLQHYPKNILEYNGLA